MAEIPASERAVLDALYTNTNGASWGNHTGWETATPVCDASLPAPSYSNWFGIQCDSTGSHVIGISFLSNNLAGPLPDLSALTQLQFFVVHNNQLTGSIPNLSALTQLQTFEVVLNQLTGSIPDLSALTQLRVFAVTFNQLTGSIPDLSTLTQLTDFEVQNNQLTGPIPDLSALTQLITFGVYYNRLTGVPPAAPSSLAAGFSGICPNYLSAPSPTDTAWNTDTATTDWHAACTNTVTGTVTAADARITTPPTLTLTCSPSTPVAVPSTPGSWQVQMSQAGSNCTLGVAGTPPAGYSYVVTYGPSAEIDASGNFAVAGADPSNANPTFSPTAGNITDLTATVTLRAGPPPGTTTSASAVPTLGETALALLAALLGLSALAAQRRRAR